MGTLKGSYTVEIDAPRDRVWDVAADVSGSVAWHPNVDEVEVLETNEDGLATRVETKADAMVRKLTSRLRFSYDRPTGIHWEQEKGQVKSLIASWQFDELDGGRTRATYAIEADPGRVLGMLLRGPVQGKVIEFTTKGPAEGIKAHIEGA